MKYVCSVCGYVHEGDSAPAECPVCKAGADKFVKQDEEMSWAAEHVVGTAAGAPEDILDQHMSAGKHRTQKKLDLPPFADDDLFDLGYDISYLRAQRLVVFAHFGLSIQIMLVPIEALSAILPLKGAQNNIFL